MPFFWTKNLNTIVPELKPIRVGFIKKARQGERIYHENGHAVTLSASGGGLGGKTGLYWIQDQVRRLHIDECKQLMGKQPWVASNLFSMKLQINLINN